MGKAARFACIFTPMALTIASFVCLTLIEVSGWNKGTLDSYYFFEANLTNLTIPAADGNTVLTEAISDVKNTLADVYQVHLWNYCSSNSSSGSDITSCSKRTSEFVFDPLTVWGLEISNGTNATSTSSGDNAVESAISTVANNAESFEQEILGDGGKKALDAYKTAAKWMFIAYQVSFWSTLATILIGILALFSRWGSFLTWILSIVSTLFTFGAVLTSTILFAILVSALNEALKAYQIKLSLGHNALVLNWLGVAFSLAATLFWLFSVCCCSGRSNPHHRSNKGGLWTAEPKGQGYYGPPHHPSSSRSLRVEKTGGGGAGAPSGYAPVSSPYMGGALGGSSAYQHHDDEEQVPLQDYAQPNPYSGQIHQGAGYEPYRHS